MASLSNPAMFVGLYLLLMLPTYMLPYFGSNSMAATIFGGVVTATTGVPLFLPFLFHLACLIGLCALTYMRGKAINKLWLLVFPFLAGVFDMVPLLTWIPLVPTVMHLLAIILGVAGTQTVPQTAQAVAGRYGDGGR